MHTHWKYDTALFTSNWQDSICVKGITLTSNSKEITLQIMRLQRFLSRKQHKSLCLILPDTITLSELISFFFFFFEELQRERLNWSWSNTKDNKTGCLLNLRFTRDWWPHHFRALKQYVQMQMTVLVKRWQHNAKIHSPRWQSSCYLLQPTYFPRNP